MPQIKNIGVIVVLSLLCMAVGMSGLLSRSVCAASSAAPEPAGKTVVFGPQQVTAAQCQAGPVVTTFPVAAPDQEGRYLVAIQNGNPAQTQVSATVAVNETTFVNYRPDFPTGPEHATSVSLFEQNTLTVMVNGGADAAVLVALVKQDKKSAGAEDNPLRIRLYPDILFLGEKEEIKIIVMSGLQSALRIEKVVLQEVDETGKVIAPIGEFFDDGNPNSGDEKARDGIFTLRKTFLENAEVIPQGGSTEVATRYLKFLVNPGMPDEMSRTVPLKIYRHLTQEEWDRQDQVQAQAGAEYRRLEKTVGKEAAIKQVLRFIARQPNVLAAGKTAGGSIWIEFVSGELGGLHISEPGTR